MSPNRVTTEYGFTLHQLIITKLGVFDLETLGVQHLTRLTAPVVDSPVPEPKD